MKWERALVPSPTDIVFLLFLVAVPLVRGYHILNTDGDLGRHIRVGETILAEGSLFPVDRFSHTMAGQPFVPYEWLSEVAFAEAHRLGGLPGVLILTGVLVALGCALVSLFLDRAGVAPLPAFGIAVLAGSVGAIHWLPRPHLFTLIGSVLTLWLLERGGRRAPWGALLLFAVWANLHGGFLYGLVLVGLYLMGDLLELSRSRDPEVWRARAHTHAWCMAGALAGTLLNPVGPWLLAHVTGYLGKSYLVDTTAEYQSPDFHQPYGKLFLGVLCAVIAMLALVSRRPSYPRLIAILVTIAFALISLRNIPLFGVVVLPLIALHLSEPSSWSPPAALKRLSAVFSNARGQAAVGVWSGVAGAGLILFMSAASVLPTAFDRSVFPVVAVAEARRAGLAGRLFNEFAWGGYVLYAWPGQPVFIDGQTDFYGESLTREYADLRAARGDWEARLAARDIALVILPPDAPLVQRLSGRPAWQRWYADSTAVVLVLRSPASTPPESRSATEAGTD